MGVHQGPACLPPSARPPSPRCPPRRQLPEAASSSAAPLAAAASPPPPSGAPAQPPAAPSSPTQQRPAREERRPCRAGGGKAPSGWQAGSGGAEAGGAGFRSSPVAASREGTAGLLSRSQLVPSAFGPTAGPPGAEASRCQARTMLPLPLPPLSMKRALLDLAQGPWLGCCRATHPSRSLQKRKIPRSCCHCLASGMQSEAISKSQRGHIVT